MKLTRKNLSTKNSKTKNNSASRWYIIILSVVVLGLVAAVSTLTCYTRTLWRDYRSDQSVVKGYIRDAIEGLYKPAVVDPQGKKQYVYEASARFILPDNNQQTFRYGYSPASGDDFSENMTLTTDNALRAGYAKLQATNIFDHVPQYQRCTRMFIIDFGTNKPDDGFMAVGTKQLADGRTAHIYKNNGCDSFYSDSGIDMARYQKIAETIESY